MGVIFTKRLFLVLISLFAIATASAQTITVGAIDPGPYGSGSTITLPFHIDNTSGCVNQTNVFKLYLSDASGSFASQVQIGTFTGFYATFVNGTIPATTLPGTGYKLRVISTSPSVTSSTSTPFTVNATAGVVAGITSQLLNNSNPEVFGVCIADENNPPPAYDFINTSTTGAVVTANFFNEITQVADATSRPIPTSFNADIANYTITVRAEKGGIVGTKSFILINNVVNNSFSVSGSTTVCLNGASLLTYNVIISGSRGIQRNFPGLSYKINWGDGLIDNYTFCDIVNAGGKVMHNYTNSSCGKSANGQNNVFKVDLQPISPYCSNLVTPLTSYAKVLSPPINDFTHPVAACVGSEVTFVNISDAGQDASSNSLDCKSLNGKYTWYVDDVPIQTNYSLGQPFKYTFLTSKEYKVRLRLQNASTNCNADDREYKVCVQKSPTPNFTLPATYCLASGPLKPTNTSIVDETCHVTEYKWTVVSGPVGGVNISANIKEPQITFSKIGVYRIRMDLTTVGCGVITGPITEIIVNDTPTADLSPDANQCGKGVTLSFNPAATSTKARLTGTAQPLANTYVWSVTAAAGGTFAFANSTTANSQYPDIIFNDYDTYTVTVTHTNSCGGPVSDSQKITFLAAPTVSAGPPQNNICEGAPIVLKGTPGVGSLVTAVQWISATGGVFTTPNSPNATYMPSLADINAGQVTLLYTATTSLPAPCNQISSPVIITIVKKATVTSSNSSSVCSGAALDYTITSVDPTTTFSWTAAITSGTATGFGAIGSGAIINDVITNNTATDAVVTYTITPTLNGCPGTPFDLNVTIRPLPVLTATAPDPAICSNQPANITVASTIAATTYTWTSVASGPGITGNTNNGTATSVTSIQDILVNTSGLSGTVTYTITPYSGTCQGAAKQVVVTINPPVIVSNAGLDQAVCNQSAVTLDGNDPLTFGGIWTQVSGPIAGVIITNPSNPKTTVTGLAGGNIYTFRWTINGAPPCGNSPDDVDIINRPDVPPTFTQNKTSGCGSTIIQFTNTSPTFPGVVYKWDFGDGTLPSNDVNPIHPFEPDATGKDIEYIVTLTTTINCTAQPPHTQIITIHPAVPKPRIFPDRTTGCGNFTLTVENTSFAKYASYRYVLFDENGDEKKFILTTDPALKPQFDIVAPLNPKIYKIKLIVVDFCGQTGESIPIDIKISPNDIKSGMFVTDYNNKCFPVTINLHNNSTGGDNFQFHITSTDGFSQFVTVGLDGTIPYAFPKAGIYNISVKASNSCGIAPATDPNDWRIDVFEKPRPDFDVNVSSGGCGNLDVTFTNKTIPDASTQPQALTYDWDFGDGTPLGHDYSDFVHPYAAAGTYTVTLTATNVTTGCFDIIVKTNVVTVYPKPVADFAVSPGLETAIPNYRFTFTDATVGNPVQWNWTFGDGQTGIGRNISHTYGDVGEFIVKLDIIDDKGCTSTITKTVKITGIPGFLYLPNAFQPSGPTVDLQKFTAKGSGVAKWQLQIFNNWGQLIWQTTALGANGEPAEGWDGTFKGAPLQQGVYIWQASATFINGTEWKGMSYNGSLPKRSGYIHLLR